MALSGEQYFWIANLVTFVLLLFCAGPAFLAGRSILTGDTSSNRAMGRFQFYFFSGVSLLFIVWILISGGFSLFGKNRWNGMDAQNRLSGLFQTFAIGLLTAVLTFGMLAPKLKVCGKGNRYCGTSMVIYIGIFMLLIPMFMVPLFLLTRGGSNTVTKDELLVANRMSPVAPVAPQGISAVNDRMEQFGLSDDYELVKAVSSTMDGRAVILKHKTNNNIYIVFGGTQSMGNWWSNLQFVSEEFDTSYLEGDIKTEAESLQIAGHKGFIDLYNNLQPSVNDWSNGDFSAIKTVYDAAPRIYIIGHSLGGALATIAALHMASVVDHYGKTTDDITLITYGAPQVGDANFAQIVDENITHLSRVVNPWDPVPHILDSQLVHTSGVKSVVPHIPWAIGVISHNLDVYYDGVKNDNFWAFFGVFVLASAVVIAALAAIVFFAGRGMDIMKAILKRWWERRKLEKQRQKIYAVDGAPEVTEEPISVQV